MDRISNEGFLNKAVELSDHENQFPIDDLAQELTLTPDDVNRFADELTDLGWIERPKGPTWQLIGEAADEAVGYRNDPPGAGAVAPAADRASVDTAIRPLMDCVNAVLRLFAQGTLRILVPTYSGTQWAGEILNAAEKVKQEWKPDSDDLVSRLRRARQGMVDHTCMPEAIEGLANSARDAFVAEMIARKIPADEAEKARKTLSIGE